MEHPYHISNQYIQILCKEFYNYVYQKLESYQRTKSKVGEFAKKINFATYFLRGIHRDKGIHYRRWGDDIILLTYDKNHSKYNNTDFVTQFCRHLVLDVSCFRIIQLGVPKCQKTDNKELFWHDIKDCYVEDLLDGTMICYTPDLGDDHRLTTHTNEDGDD